MIAYVKEVRHVTRMADWPYSTFHCYVQQGIYPPDWAGSADDLQVVHLCTLSG